jgi:hypothetical protein
MRSIEVSGLLLQPLAERVRGWLAEGKLDENDLEQALTSDARAYVDHQVARGDWARLADVEGLVDLIAEQLGGEPGIVEWAGEVVEDWLLEPPIEQLLWSARRLTDAPGFVVSQTSERLVRQGAWHYEGGAERFTVRLSGIGAASAPFKALVGGTLARLAERAGASAFDVRFDGIDGDELVVFGELECDDRSLSESRLQRAALIP